MELLCAVIQRMGVFSRVVKTTIPLGAAALTAYAYKDDIASPFRQLNSFVTDVSSSSTTFDSNFPRGRWNTNWDFRDPMSLVNEKKYSKATDEEKKKMIKEATPTATRTIVLIRHGQYDQKNKPHPLSELGREQAVLVGKRLAASHKRTEIDVVHMSTMTRATETANIILDQLPSEIPRNSDSILEEGAPYPPVPEHSEWKPPANEFYSEGARIESAFRKYIHRASVKQKKHTLDVIVCHGNVIRYFVCRALQFPPEGWLRMGIANCSITVLSIRPNGEVSIRSVGDIGHLPDEKITFN